MPLVGVVFVKMKEFTKIVNKNRKDKIPYNIKDMTPEQFEEMSKFLCDNI